MNVFSYDSYKDLLKGYLELNDERGIVSRIAAACGCDRTYLSQVLSGKAELTPDHVVQLCDFLHLNESESDYVTLLTLRDRSSSIKARKILEAKVRQVKKEALALTAKISEREKPRQVDEEHRHLYYSTWLYGAVHTLTSIEEFQTPTALAEKLQLPLPRILQLLKGLVEMQVVRFEKGHYVHSNQDLYLPGDHPQILAHHLSWRMKAMERTTIKEDVHYTVAFSVSEQDVDKLRSQVLELIEKQRKTVRQSGAETACVFCVDFYEI